MTAILAALWVGVIGAAIGFVWTFPWHTGAGHLVSLRWALTAIVLFGSLVVTLLAVGAMENDG